MLEAQLKTLTKRFESKTMALENISTELDMANNTIGELESTMTKQHTQRETQINGKELEIVRLKNSVRKLKNQIDSDKEKNDLRQEENLEKAKMIEALEIKLEYVTTNKVQLLEAMNGLKEEGAMAVESMNDWLGGKSEGVGSKNDFTKKVSERTKRASLEEDKHTGDESREMATYGWLHPLLN